MTRGFFYTYPKWDFLTKIYSLKIRDSTSESNHRETSQSFNTIGRDNYWNNRKSNGNYPNIDWEEHNTRCVTGWRFWN